MVEGDSQQTDRNIYRESQYGHFLDKHDKRVHATVSEDQHKQLENIAIQTQASISAVVRMAVQFFLDNFRG